MTFESLVTVFIKIVNSAACVGLYYGLLIRSRIQFRISR